jgi:ribosomal protein L25 (general stress protein Ctc)
VFAVRWCSLDWLADLPYGRTMSSNGDSAARALPRLRKAGFVAAVVYGGFAIANEVAL